MAAESRSRRESQGHTRRGARSGLPLTNAALSAVGADVLQRTAAQRLRSDVQTQDGAERPTLDTIAMPPLELPARDVLEIQLRQTRQLREFYEHVRGAAMSHLPSLVRAARAANVSVTHAGATANVSQEPQAPPATVVRSEGSTQAVERSAACFSDAEEAAIATSTASEERDSQWQGALQHLAKLLPAIADHESAVVAAAMADMDAEHACAVLCGRKRRYYLRQTAVLLGRSTDSKGQVDVDLSEEAPCPKCSRVQCLLELDLTFGFIVRNVGRQTMFVNRVEVPHGQKTKVPHLSLLEVAGVRLLFLVNLAAIQRICLEPLPRPASVAAS